MPVAEADRPVTIAELEDLERRLSRPDIDAEIGRLKGWRRSMEEDQSFGRMFSGPQWLGGASIVDGTVEGNVFKAQVTISNIFLTAESPADRWELDPNGFRAYATVSAVPNTKTYDFHTDGDFELGVSPNQITFVASTGTLTVPAAVIGALTIADVGSGTIGGSYQSSTLNPKMEISVSGITATNAGGTTTFDLDATTGDLFMVGNFTIASSLSASARIEISQTGIEIWKGGTQEFLLSNSTNVITMLLTGGSVGQYIGMNPSTGLWLGASSFGSAPFRVEPDGDVTMTSATITNGTLTSPSISSATITGTTITGQTIRTSGSNPRVEMTSSGVFAYNSGGTNTAALNSDGSGFMGTGGLFAWTTAGALSVNGTALDNNSVASGKIASLAVDKLTSGTITSQTITLGSGGSITDADGSTWTQSGFTLVSSGVFGDTIKWVVSGSDRGSIWATAGGDFTMGYPSGGEVSLTSNLATLGAPGDSQFQMSIASGNLFAQLSDAGGTTQFQVKNSSADIAFGATSNGSLIREVALSTTALGTYRGRIPIFIEGEGSASYIAVYNA